VGRDDLGLKDDNPNPLSVLHGEHDEVVALVPKESDIDLSVILWLRTERGLRYLMVDGFSFSSIPR